MNYTQRNFTRQRFLDRLTSEQRRKPLLLRPLKLTTKEAKELLAKQP